MKILMKYRFILLVAVICSFASVANAEMTPEKRVEIDKMLRLTGVEKLMTQMMGQIISAFKAQNSAVPAEFWTKFQQQMDPHDLIQKIYPIYDKYYSLEDIKAANAFYESPAGQRILSVTPQITMECMKVGEDWGREKAMQIEQQLKAQSPAPQ
jgi:hypothetical protein